VRVRLSLKYSNAYMILIKSNPQPHFLNHYYFAFSNTLNISSPNFYPPVYYFLAVKVVLDSFLYSNSKAFLDVIKRWSAVTPPLFNHAVLLQRLQNRKGALGSSSVGAGKENLRVQKWDLVEAKAQLHILAKEHEEALNCYLEMNIAHTAENNEENDLDGGINTSGSNDNSTDNPNGVPQSAGRVKKHTYRHVFELIEREVRLFSNLSCLSSPAMPY
jgi:hypothetical protein